MRVAEVEKQVGLVGGLPACGLIAEVDLKLHAPSQPRCEELHFEGQPELRKMGEGISR